MCAKVHFLKSIISRIATRTGLCLALSDTRVQVLSRLCLHVFKSCFLIIFALMFIFFSLLLLLPVIAFMTGVMDVYICISLFQEKVNYELCQSKMSRNMKFSTMWYVRPAKPQISLCICAEIEISVPRITVWHHDAYLTQIMDSFFFCIYGIFIFKNRLQEVPEYEYAGLRH